MDREEKKSALGCSKWRGPDLRQPELERDSPDQELIAWAQAGDPKGLAALYEKYRRPILNYLYRFTGNRAAAEDLTQETFLRVVRYLGSYRPTGSAAGWIYRIAKNLALNKIRDQRSHPEFSMDEPIVNDQGEEQPRQDLIPGRTPDPEQQAEQSETEAALQQALLKIAVPYRETLILCDIQGTPYKEAAEILHCSINTVASRLARGRIRLAGLLGYLRQERGL